MIADFLNLETNLVKKVVEIITTKGEIVINMDTKVVV